MSQKARAFIGAGANLGEPVRQIRQAIDALQKIPGVGLLGASSFYRTQPMGPIAQPPFVNAVFSLECGISAQELLALLLSVEEKMGRIRRERWGPRVIDLDLLFFDEAIISEQGLEVPHPRLHERRFVLTPLVEIAPDVVHPVLKKSAFDLLAALPAEGPWVEKLQQQEK